MFEFVSKGIGDDGDVAIIGPKFLQLGKVGYDGLESCIRYFTAFWVIEACQIGAFLSNGNDPFICDEIASLDPKRLQLWKVIGDVYQRIISNTFTVIEANIYHFLFVDMIRIGKEIDHMAVSQL